MSIYKRGSIWWAYVKIGKRRFRQSLETMDRLEAEEREKALRLKLMNGSAARDRSVVPPTLEKAFERFINRYEGESKRVVWSHAQSIMRVLGAETTLDKVKAQDISHMIDAFKAEGNEGATINRKTSTLAQLLKTACYEWKVIHDIPHIRRFKESQGRIRTISYEEETRIKEIFRSWGEHDAADLVTFLVDTGARLSEGLRLKCEDISWNQLCIFIWKTKNKTPRVVPITDRVNALLKERCQVQELDRPFGMLNQPHLSYIWAKARKEMGIDDKDFTIHALRHTTATRLINAGVPIYVVQRFLGHSTVKVTERYAHLSSEPLRAAADILNNQMSPALGEFINRPMRDHAFTDDHNPWSKTDPPIKKPT